MAARAVGGEESRPIDGLLRLFGTAPEGEGEARTSEQNEHQGSLHTRIKHAYLFLAKEAMDRRVRPFYVERR